MSGEKDEKPEEKPATVVISAEEYENLKKSVEDSKKAINAMAQAIIELKSRIESQAGGGAAGSADPKAVEELLKAFGLSEKKESDLEGVVKAAEGLAKLGDSLDRFRKPSPIGAAEALLMRAGLDRLRHPIPRYMTKKELSAYEKLLGIELEEEEEGESEH